MLRDVGSINSLENGISAEREDSAFDTWTCIDDGGGAENRMPLGASWAARDLLKPLIAYFVEA
ncbi:hypothetical protein ABL57_01620 [Kocuria sp. SM24M-10]|nr:hypothetical protein ABL57_01620 [Kocuria sp. SM24M-10]